MCSISIWRWTPLTAEVSHDDCPLRSPLRDGAHPNGTVGLVSRGVLRIYLGAAPGVGKTFAMLDEGWRRKERGTDVVVGYVETHHRPNTEAQLRALEIIPRKVMPYRDQQFEEMDVDAIVARKP